MLLMSFLQFVSLASLDLAAEAALAVAGPSPPALSAAHRLQEAPPGKLAGDLGLFLPARGDLELSWEPEHAGLSPLELLKRYGDLTGQELVIDRETHMLLQADLLPIERQMIVPAAQVQGFVEAMLADRYALSAAEGSEPRLVAVHNIRGNARNLLTSRARFVPSERIELLSAHPAVMFSTLIELRNLDSRYLSNTMRSLILDPTLQVILPVEDSVLLVGFGSWIAHTADQLRALDAASGPAPPPAIVHELVRLTHADALEVAPLVERSLDVARAQRQGSAELQKESKRTGPSVQAYPRLNALWVTCFEGELEEVRRLAAALDVE